MVPTRKGVAGLRDAESRTSTEGVDSRQLRVVGGGRGGGLFRRRRVCARTTTRMYLMLEYSRHPLGAGGGQTEKKERVSAQQEARCSADKRAFRATMRDHILQLMRLVLTLRYFLHFSTVLSLVRTVC